MTQTIKDAISYRMTRGYGLNLIMYKIINNALKENRVIYNKKTNEFIEK